MGSSPVARPRVGQRMETLQGAWRMCRHCIDRHVRCVLHARSRRLSIRTCPRIVSRACLGFRSPPRCLAPYPSRATTITSASTADGPDRADHLARQQPFASAFLRRPPPQCARGRPRERSARQPSDQLAVRPWYPSDSAAVEVHGAPTWSARTTVPPRGACFVSPRQRAPRRQSDVEYATAGPRRPAATDAANRGPRRHAQRRAASPQDVQLHARAGRRGRVREGQTALGWRSAVVRQDWRVSAYGRPAPYLTSQVHVVDWRVVIWTLG